ncbi:MAG: hypothetical protein ACYDCQ_17460 [Dehalococcoidia bacterium]
MGELCRGACSLCGAEREFTNQRFPFGQPGHVRKATATARPAAAAVLTSEQTLFARLLARTDAVEV